jgi:hypothetical protein
MGSWVEKINNTIWTGLTIGFLVPLLSGCLVLLLMQKVAALRKADLLLIGCIALNAVLMNFFFKKNKDHIARGILSITFLWAFAFFFYKLWQETRG